MPNVRGRQVEANGQGVGEFKADSLLVIRNRSKSAFGVHSGN